MKIIGTTLIIIGVLRILFGYDDNSAVRMTWYAVEGMGLIITGSIFLTGQSVINAILEIKDNKDNIQNINSEKYLTYTIVFKDGKEINKNIKIGKNNWDNIIEGLEEYGEVHYIIDEDGRRVFKGGYLG